MNLRADYVYLDVEIAAAGSIWRSRISILAGPSGTSRPPPPLGLGHVNSRGLKNIDCQRETLGLLHLQFSGARGKGLARLNDRLRQ